MQAVRNVSGQRCLRCWHDSASFDADKPLLVSITMTSVAADESTSCPLKILPPELWPLQILVSGPSDYDVSGGTSRCIQMVDRAKALTQTSIMFVPTLFWVNENAASLSSVNQQVCTLIPC